MAKKNIKLRARLKDGIVTVKALIKHPMETGLRKDKVTGLKVPAYHITEIVRMIYSLAASGAQVFPKILLSHSLSKVLLKGTC